MYDIQKFRRRAEYIPNVWTSTLKIYCTVVLLRSHITAVSPTVEHQSVSVTSLTSTPYHQLQVIWNLSLFFRNSSVTKSLMPLIMKGPWNDDKKMNPSFLVNIGILPTSMETFMRTYCSAQNPDVMSFWDFSSVYLTTKYHHINIRNTTAFKFATSDVRCSPDINV